MALCTRIAASGTNKAEKKEEAGLGTQGRIGK